MGPRVRARLLSVIVCSAWSFGGDAFRTDDNLAELAQEYDDAEESTWSDVDGSSDVATAGKLSTAGGAAAVATTGTKDDGGRVDPDDAGVATVDFRRGKCVLTEMHRAFLPYYSRWQLLSALGERLLYEDAGRILNSFQAAARPLVTEDIAQINSPRRFAGTLGQNLRKASRRLNFTGIERTQAEVLDFLKLGLQSAGFFGDEAQQEALEALETGLCNELRVFADAAEHEEQNLALLKGDPEGSTQRLWTVWQEAWGPIRVFIKVTTQCRVEVPRNKNVHVFLRKRHQPEWERCANVGDWKPNQFPSAVMACARNDGEHVHSRGPILDRNRMVRYLGCGGNRLELDRTTHETIEPPVEQGVSEACAANSQAGREFNTALCGPGTLQSGSCRVYGPFWGIYSARLEHFLGKKETGDNECPLTGERECGSMPQLEAFKAMGNEASAHYIYGMPPPLTMSRGRAWRDGVEPKGWEQEMDWPLDLDRRLDPPLWEVLREVELGTSVVMISYGFSGAGKTTTLIGDAECPVGGGNGLDGVLSIYLQDNAERIQDIRFRAIEIYGRFSAEDGSIGANTGSGLWGYDLRENTAKYLGGHSAFVPTRAGATGVDFARLEAVLSHANYTTNLRDVIPPSTQGKLDWGAEVKKFLVRIERIRKTAGAFVVGGGDGPPLAHIRATPNNPKSSRGTLYVTAEIDFKNGQTGSVTVVDLAGAEDPAVMVEGFMGFKAKDDVEGCIGEAEWDPMKSSKQLTQKYLHRMGDYSVLNDELGQCIKMRNFLVECARQKGKPPKPECTNIELSSGKTRLVRPDPEAPIVWSYQPKNLEFKLKGQTMSFTQEEVLAAKSAGDPKGVNGLKLGSSPAGENRCGKSETEECPGHWVERLWAACGKDENGRCVRPGMLDGIALGKKLSPPSRFYGYPGSLSGGGGGNKRSRRGGRNRGRGRGRGRGRQPSKPEINDEDLPLRAIPKMVVKNSGSVAQRGKAWNERTAKDWRQARLELWREVHEVMKIFENAEESRDADDWELHLKYFTSVVGPMVEEAVYINEAMNEMKAFLGLWSKKTIGVPTGSPIQLWPPAEMASNVKRHQVVDTTPGTPYAKLGYDINMFLRAKSAEESYIMEATEGVDQVMMLTMLEQLRRPGMERHKDTKVLFGTFIRSDKPGADPNCEGARISLEFAQGVSDAIGWDRNSALHHLH